MRPLALHTILLAIDLSDASRPAVQTAVELAKLAGATLHAVHARTGDGVADNAVTEHLRRILPDAAALARSRVVADAPPHEAIVERARVVDADVIVLGPHRREAQGGPLGTTADAVVRTAHIPCLVLPQSLTLPLERVLVASDLSTAAQGAIAVALSWASALRRPSSIGGGTELRVVYVAPRHGEDGSEGALRDEVERARDRADTVAHVEIHEVRVHADDPASAILGEANASRADLLVLGTRGQGAGNDDGMGSVSTGVVQQTSCPVLLVP